MNIHKILLILLSLNLTSCISVGKNFDLEKMNEIKINISTRQNVIDILGEPESIGISDNLLIFQYLSIKGAMSNLKLKKLFIVFNKNNTVKEVVLDKNKKI